MPPTPFAVIAIVPPPPPLRDWLQSTLIDVTPLVVAPEPIINGVELFVEMETVPPLGEINVPLQVMLLMRAFAPAVILTEIEPDPPVVTFPIIMEAGWVEEEPP